MENADSIGLNPEYPSFFFCLSNIRLDFLPNLPLKRWGFPFFWHLPSGYDRIRKEQMFDYSSTRWPDFALLLAPEKVFKPV